MDPARHKPQVGTDNARERPLAAVTPLFARDVSPQAGFSRTVVVSNATANTNRGLGMLLAAATLALMATVFHSRRAAEQLEERMDLGCLDVDDCRSLVHTAETAKEACWIGCGPLANLVEQARGRFRVALEQVAHRERELQDHAYERTLSERRENEAAVVLRDREQQRAELEMRHRHELELIAAETERLKEEKARLAAQRTAYLRQLTRPQRLRRLQACHALGGDCDEIASALTAAASSEEERSVLTEAHERHVAGPAGPASRSSSAVDGDPLELDRPTPISATADPSSEPAPL